MVGMRMVLVMVLLAGCATDRPADRDIHNVVECPTDSTRMCEQGCIATPAVTPGICHASNPETSFTYTCTETFDLDGTRGCCYALIDNGGTWTDRFFECN